MQKRISHKKSRRGCQSCKRKHVKCDEQGPPCANCVVRKIECVYPPHSESGVKKKKPTPLARRPKHLSPQDAVAVVAASDSQGHSRGTSPGSPSDGSNSTLAILNPTTSPNTPSPSAFSNISESNRLLELELMNRWSTRTWTGLFSVPIDQEYLQVVLPRSALKENYLMNGIFAMAAADLARYSNGRDSAMYFRAALEYGNKASVEFRSKLSSINEENLHLLYHFAVMAAIFNFVVPAEHMSTMDRIFTVFDMMLGAAHVGWFNFGWLLDSPCGTRTVVKIIPEIIMHDLDPETFIALDRLRAVSRRIRVRASATANNNNNGSEEGKGESCFASESVMYKLSISQLYSCFLKEAHEYINSYFLTFITTAGAEFSEAIKQYEPMALFILMHFGVLLDRSKGEQIQWWIASAGIELVRDVSEMLIDTPVASIPEGRAGISWSREQVGLPQLSPLMQLTVEDNSFFDSSTWDLQFEQGEDLDPSMCLRNIYHEATIKKRIKEFTEGSNCHE